MFRRAPHTPTPTPTTPFYIYCTMNRRSPNHYHSRPSMSSPSTPHTPSTSSSRRTRRTNRTMDSPKASSPAALDPPLQGGSPHPTAVRLNLPGMQKQAPPPSYWQQQQPELHASAPKPSRKRRSRQLRAEADGTAIPAFSNPWLTEEQGDQDVPPAYNIEEENRVLRGHHQAVTTQYSSAPLPSTRAARIPPHLSHNHELAPSYPPGLPSYPTTPTEPLPHPKARSPIAPTTVASAAPTQPVRVRATSARNPRYRCAPAAPPAPPTIAELSLPKLGYDWAAPTTREVRHQRGGGKDVCKRVFSSLFGWVDSLQGHRKGHLERQRRLHTRCRVETDDLDDLYD